MCRQAAGKPGWLEADGKAWGRPVDAISGSDGALYITDDRNAAVYPVSYEGK